MVSHEREVGALRPKVVEIPVPVRGFVEGLSGAAQPKATYSQGLNVRSRDEGSEQVGLTQRSGLVAVATGLGGAPREMFLASRETPPHTWHELNTTPQDGVRPAEVEGVFDTDARGDAHARAVDRDGTSYILRTDGAVDIFNADGRYIETAESPIQRGFTVLARIAVDEDRGIYLAGVRSDVFDGGASRLVRLRKRDDQWGLHWIVTIVEPVADFAYTLNSVFVYANPLPQVGENTQVPDQRATLVRFTQVFSSAPFRAWTRPAPRPAWHVLGLTDGSAVISSPANALRNDAATVAFTARNVGWTPRELADWGTRIHAWIDGVRPTDGFFAEDGSPVERLADARRFPSAFPPTNDATTRELVVDPHHDFDPPVWSAAAFGGLGATYFSGDQVLASGLNRDVTDRSLQEALIPGIDETFALFLVVEISALAMLAATEYRIFTQASDGAQLAMYLTVTPSGTGDFMVILDDLSGLRASDIVSVASDVLLLTIIHGGSGGSNGRFRVNGEHISNLTFGSNAILSGGAWNLDYATAGVLTHPGPRTALGAHRLPADHNMLVAATAVVTSPTIGGASNRVRDGIIAAGSANRIVLSEGGHVLRATFADEVSITGIAFWTSNIGSQASEVSIRGGNDPTFALFVATYTGNFDQRLDANQFPARDHVDFGEQASFRYWEIEAIDTYGSGGDWGVTEVEFLRQAEQVELTFAPTAGVLPILESAPMGFGQMIVLMEPEDPGAMNATGVLGALPEDVTDVEAIEGYLAHRFGIAHQLPVDHVYYGAGNFPQGAGDDRRDQVSEAALNSPLPIVARVAPSSELMWARAAAGVGYGAAAGTSGALFTVGEAFPSTGDSMTTEGWGAWLRRWANTSRDLDPAAAAAWEQTVATPDEDLQRRKYDIGVDATNDLYVTRFQADGTITLDRRQGEDGEPVFEFPVTVGERPIDFRPVPGKILRNPGDADTAGPARASATFFGEIDALRGYAVMGQSQSGAPRPRELEVVAVVGEDVFAVDEGGAVTTVSTSAFFDEELWSATSFGLTFVGGSRGYLVYDHEFRTLRAFEGSTRGEFPPRCRLGVFWNGRLWLGAGDDPFDWYMARWGEPFDMDFYPEVPDEAQPVSSQSSPIGPIPDPLRCLMPWTSDIAYVGCESSLWRIEGDPASDGRLVFVANVGVAMGQGSYTKDDRGNLYFYAAHGDVCIVRIGSGQPVSIADTRVGARLKDIDLTVFRPKLVWNTAERALHVFFLPRAGVVADVAHLVWQADFDAWHPDHYAGGHGRAVTSALAFDGSEPGDRTILIGFADGGIRRVFRHTEEDDGLPLPWSFVAGPISDRGLLGAARMTSLHVTSLGDGEFRITAWGTDRPHRPGVSIPGHSIAMKAGQTGGISPTASGAMLYVAAHGTTRVTIQNLAAGLVSAGRVQQ